MKKLLVKALGITLSAAITITSVPVTATEVNPVSAAEDAEVIQVNPEADPDAETESAATDREGTVEETETVNEPETLPAESEGGAEENQEKVNASETEPVYTLDDLTGMDWENMSEEDISKMLSHAEEDALYLFLTSLSEADYNQITQMPYFANPVKITTYDVAEDGTTTEKESREMTILDYILENFKKEEQRADWKASTATYFVDFVLNDAVTRYKLNTKGLSGSNTQNYTISLVQSVMANNMPLNIAPSFSLANTRLSPGPNGQYYTRASFNLSFTKPIGYSNSIAFTGEDVTYSGAGNNGAYSSASTTSGVLTVNLWNNTGAGNADTNGKTIITFAAHYYSIPNMGVGNTLIGTPCRLPASGTPANYTVFYDGNGGTTPQSSTGSRPVVSWTLGDLNEVITPTVEGEHDLQPKYGDDGVTLPASTGQTFYAYLSDRTAPLQATQSFAGWYNGSAYVGGAGAGYKPGTNVTLTAHWTPAAVGLPTPSKQCSVSYDVNGGVTDNEFKATETINSTFLGWDDTATSNVESYTGNLTLNKDVSLKATWNATQITLPKAPVKKGSFDLKFNLDGGTMSSPVKPVDYICEFKGWKDADGNIYAAEENVAVDSDKAYTAQWSDVAATVDFSTLKVNAREGYDFSGWTVNGTEAKGNITVTPDTVITATWKAKKPDNPVYPDPDFTDILKKLEEVKKLSDLTSAEITEVKTLIEKAYGFTDEQTQKLYDLINKSGLSEEQKMQILRALAEGSLSEEQKNQLIEMIKNSSLSDTEKKTLIDKINSLSYLSMEEQKKILEALEKGSSAGYAIGGIDFVIQKNPDGTLTIKLGGLNGQTHVVIPDSVTVAGKTFAVTEIARESFKDNKTIQSVVMGNNIAKICDSAFENCTALKAVTIGPNVKEIGAKAFKGCTALTNISIPQSVLKIGDSAFENCTALKTVILHEGLMQIGKRAFYNCKALVKVKIPKSVVKILGYAFGKCIRLKTVTFATDSLLVTMGEGVFSNCKVLQKIKLPGKLTAIAKKTFYNDTKLTACTGGNNVTKIGTSAFEKCKKLKYFTVQSKVQSIYKKAFYNCRSLKTVTIKSRALTTVGSQAFKKCKKGIRFKCPNNKISEYTKLLKGKY